jgi:diacylglycerol diphosphate phosphatase/phosphatidate phosphatase
MGFTLADVDSHAVKMGVGRPRPDMITRCHPHQGPQQSSVWGLSNFTICTQIDAHLSNHGLKGVVSGLSSCTYGHCKLGTQLTRVASLVGLDLAAFYLAERIHLAYAEGHPVSSLPTDTCRADVSQTRASLTLSPLSTFMMDAVFGSQRSYINGMM